MEVDAADEKKNGAIETSQSGPISVNFTDFAAHFERKKGIRLLAGTHKMAIVIESWTTAHLDKERLFKMSSDFNLKRFQRQMKSKLGLKKRIQRRGEVHFMTFIDSNGIAEAKRRPALLISQFRQNGTDQGLFMEISSAPDAKGVAIPDPKAADRREAFAVDAFIGREYPAERLVGTIKFHFVWCSPIEDVAKSTHVPVFNQQWLNRFVFPSLLALFPQ